MTAALHPSLQQFTVLEEIPLHGGHRTLLAESKSGSRVIVEILADTAIPEDIAPALAKAASASARLSHETIVQARAVVLEADLAAVVSEFVPGVSLQRLLRFAVGRGVRLPDDVGFAIIGRVLTALAHAHGAKDVKGKPAPVVHGRPSAESVVVGWNGITKTGDFGGAKMRALVAPVVKAEEPEFPHIIAPEVAKGSEPTERSDVFCAALLALRVATGRTPYARFRESRASMMIAMSDVELTPLAKTRPDLPASLRDAITRALEPDPEKRTITAEELAEQVRIAFDPAKGKEALVTLLARWRDGLEATVAPWEKRGSQSDREPTADGATRESALTLATADERPSVPTMGLREREREEDLIVKSEKNPIPPEEVALLATSAPVSLSRMGAAASDALTMPPLPPVQIHAPSIPVYGGPAVNLPRGSTTTPTGNRAIAFAMLFLFIVIAVGAVLLIKFLSSPTVP